MSAKNNAWEMGARNAGDGHTVGEVTQRPLQPNLAA
jgi:hypothetical protein